MTEVDDDVSDRYDELAERYLALAEAPQNQARLTALEELRNDAVAAQEFGIASGVLLTGAVQMAGDDHATSIRWFVEATRDYKAHSDQWPEEVVQMYAMFGVLAVFAMISDKRVSAANIDLAISTLERVAATEGHSPAGALVARMAWFSETGDKAAARIALHDWLSLGAEEWNLGPAWMLRSMPHLTSTVDPTWSRQELRKQLTQTRNPAERMDCIDRLAEIHLREGDAEGALELVREGVELLASVPRRDLDVYADLQLAAVEDRELSTALFRKAPPLGEEIDMYESQQYAAGLRHLERWGDDDALVERLRTLVWDDARAFDERNGTDAHARDLSGYWGVTPPN